MHPLQKTTALLLTAAMALPCLNSCYFNSAGHLFAKASHKEAVNTFGLKPGNYVFQDVTTGWFYLELPRYKTEKPVSTQYDPLSLCSNRNKVTYSQHIAKVPGENITVRISREFAQYLMGITDDSYRPTASDMVVVQDRKLKKNLCRAYTIVRTPGSLIKNYTYQSPNRIGWQTLGVLDWLCVDLPVTCVENSLALTFMVVGWPIMIEAALDSESASTEKRVVPHGWYMTPASPAVAKKITPPTLPSTPANTRTKVNGTSTLGQNTPKIPGKTEQDNTQGSDTHHDDPGWDDDSDIKRN